MRSNTILLALSPRRRIGKKQSQQAKENKPSHARGTGKKAVRAGGSIYTRTHAHKSSSSMVSRVKLAARRRRPVSGIMDAAAAGVVRAAARNNTHIGRGAGVTKLCHRTNSIKSALSFYLPLSLSLLFCRAQRGFGAGSSEVKGRIYIILVGLLALMLFFLLPRPSGSRSIESPKKSFLLFFSFSFFLKNFRLRTPRETTIMRCLRLRSCRGCK